MMEEWVTQLHIPRTAGTALREAMRGYPWWRFAGHETRLEDVTGHVAVTVREPVARFVSSAVWARLELQAVGYPDPEALARDIGALERVNGFAAVMFRPQLTWLGSIAQACERCLWIGHVETLGDDVERLCRLLGVESWCLPEHGHAKRNAAPETFELSPLAADNVRDWYAVDVALVETVR